MARYTVPANESWLALQNWTTATLDGSKWEGSTWEGWPPVGNISHLINLTVLPDNIAALHFPTADHQYFDAIFVLARMVLSPDYYSTAVFCVHPVSGTYATLTRILFYTLVFFSFVFRQHAWLAVPAAGTAMIYAATVAVHALALLTQLGWTFLDDYSRSGEQNGDPDLLHAWPILVASLVLTTPALNWSTSVRRTRAQIILVAWSFLIFAALAPVLLTISHHPNGEPFRNWNFNRVPALVLCPSDLADNPACAITAKLSTEKYRRCQCVNFCGLFEPNTPMRRNTPMVPYLRSQSYYGWAQHPVIWKLAYYIEILAVTIALYGFLLLLFNPFHFSYREMRNLIFRILNIHPAVIKAFWKIIMSRLCYANSSCAISGFEDIRTGVRKWQYRLAKLMAMLFFLTGAVATLISPIVLALNVVFIEITMLYVPNAEDYGNVGAWGPWVGTACVFGAGVIFRVQDAWEFLLIRCSDKVLQLTGFLPTQKDAQDKPSLHSNVPGPGVGSFRSVLDNVRIHIQSSIRGNVASVKFAYTEFKQWTTISAPHSRMCICKSCVSDRTLILKMRDSTESFGQYHSILRNHINNSKGCGCRLCHLKREKAMPEGIACPCWYCSPIKILKDMQDPDELDIIRNESSEYGTLGTRILQMIDDRIDDLLDQQIITADEHIDGLLP